MIDNLFLCGVHGVCVVFCFVSVGESAGANLTAVACLRLRDDKVTPQPVGQVLIVPYMSVGSDTLSAHAKGQGKHWLTWVRCGFFWIFSRHTIPIFNNSPHILQQQPTHPSTTAQVFTHAISHSRRRGFYALHIPLLLPRARTIMTVFHVGLVCRIWSTILFSRTEVSATFGRCTRASLKTASIRTSRR